MVLKEFKCINPECGHEFESLADICPLCASDAKRAFRTPPGVATNKGRPMAKSKIQERILEKEFNRQGIANFTNRGGENKVSWKSRVNRQYPGVYNTQAHGIHQHPIQGMIAKPGDFSGLQRKYGADPNSFAVDGVPYSMNSRDYGVDNSFEGLEPREPVKVGAHRPSELMRKTEVIRHPEGDPKFSDSVVDEVIKHS
jgi:hypothetical protein